MSSVNDEQYVHINGAGFQTAPRKIIIVGGGASGIHLAYVLTRLHRNVEFVIYEECDRVGGTWAKNRYPGVACDVYTSVYQFSWNPNPRWSRMYAPGSEILEYMEKSAEQAGLLEYFKLGHKVTKAEWDEDTAKWTIRGNGPKGPFADQADIFINAMGCLNLWKWPDLAGRENYTGSLYHSAEWPSGADEKLRDKSVAVIGNGASAVQIVPAIFDKVKSLDFYFRTAAWMGSKPPPNSYVLKSGHDSTVYTAEQKETWQKDTKAYDAYRRGCEAEYNFMLYGALLKDHELQHQRRSAMQTRMENKIADPRLRELLIPQFAAGCRRVTPEEGFLEALQAPKTEVINTPLASFVPEGLKLASGEVRPAEVIICATGFDVSWKPPFPIVGRNGADLAKKWADHAEALQGILVDDFPNYVSMVGPASPVAQGSIISVIEMQGHWVSMMLDIIQKSRIKKFAPKRECVEAYNVHLQSLMSELVWTDTCRSWFKNAKGRIVGGYAGSMYHYAIGLSRVRTEDLELEYENANPYWSFGNGWVEGEAEMACADTLPWLSYIRKLEDVPATLAN